MIHLDRISALPDELVDCILDKLPVPDVLRTDVLSKRWRYCWTRFGNLDFSSEFFTEHIESGPHDLVNIIDSVLFNLRGRIYRFHLHLSREPKKYNSLDLSKWMHFLAKNGVEDVSVSFNSIGVLPSNVFECCSLQRLSLENCIFDYLDEYKGFEGLVSLKMKNCSVRWNVQTILSNSPLLEELEILYGVGGAMFKSDALCGGTRIKSLVYQSNDREELLCCEELPELTYAIINSKIEVPMSSSTATKLDQFSCFLPRIKKLVLNWLTMSSFTSGDIPFRLTSSFRFLERLKLQSIDTASVDVANFLFCIMRSAPKLQWLNISDMLISPTNESMAADVTQYYSAQGSEGVLSGMHTFQLDVGTGATHMLSLIQVILKCCPKLETVTIRSRLTTWFSEAVKQLPRSSIVELICPHANFESTF